MYLFTYYSKHTFRWLRLWGLGLLLGLGSLNGQIITVSSLVNAGAGSLREAIETAASGDTIDFAVQGSILLDSSLVIGKDLTLIGPGPDLLKLDGQSSVRVMRIDTSATDSIVEVRIKGITFHNGNAIEDNYDQFPSGGALRNFSRLTLDECLFYDNQAGWGGAIDNSGALGRHAVLTLNNCTFFRNSADPAPMAPVPANRTKAGGAIYSDAVLGGRCEVTATNCTFSGNKATDDGGAIFFNLDRLDMRHSFSCYHCTITDNESAKGGGTSLNRVTHILQNTIIAGNRGRAENPDIFGRISSGGGLLVGRFVDNSSTSYNPQDSTDQINVDPMLSLLVAQGSAIPAHIPLCGSPVIKAGISQPLVPTDTRGYNRGTLPDLGAAERYAMREIQVINKVDKGGGSLRLAIALACPGDTIDLRSLQGTINLVSEIFIDKPLTILGNPDLPLRLRASGPNRIFTVDAPGPAFMKHLNFTHGRPDLYGGGAIRNKGTLRLEACALYDNRAISGGAIGNYGDTTEAQLFLINCTLSGNEATLLDGGAIDNFSIGFSAFVSLDFCTVSDNLAVKRGGGVFSNTGASSLYRNTIIGNNSAANGPDLFGTGHSSDDFNLILDDADANFSAKAGDIIGQNPMLGPLANYGGPTLTHRLRPDSPAIDAANWQGTPPLDQRGYPRVFNNTADIGAYEADPATAIEALGKDAGIILYPNPAKERVWINLPNAQLNYQLRIYSPNGQLIREQSLAEEAVPSIELSGLSSGFYLVELVGHNHFFRQKLMIID